MSNRIEYYKSLDQSITAINYIIYILKKMPLIKF